MNGGGEAIVITNQILSRIDGLGGDEAEGAGAGEKREEASGEETGGDKETEEAESGKLRLGGIGVQGREPKFETFVHKTEAARSDSDSAYFEDLTAENAGLGRGGRGPEQRAGKAKDRQGGFRFETSESSFGTRPQREKEDLQEISLQKMGQYLYSFFQSKQKGGEGSEERAPETLQKPGNRGDFEGGARALQETELLQTEVGEETEPRPEKESGGESAEKGGDLQTVQTRVGGASLESALKKKKAQVYEQMESIMETVDKAQDKDRDSLERVRELELRNATLESESKALAEKNEELGARVKALEADCAASASRTQELQTKSAELGEENESLQKKLALLEKEVTLYREKLEKEEAKLAALDSSQKRAGELEAMLEQKNKKIIELELDVKNLRLKQNKSLRQISRSNKESFEVSPLSLIWDPKAQGKPPSLAKAERVPKTRVEGERESPALAPVKVETAEARKEEGPCETAKPEEKAAETTEGGGEEGAPRVTLFSKKQAGQTEKAGRPVLFEDSKLVRVTELSAENSHVTLPDEEEDPGEVAESGLMVPRRVQPSGTDIRKPSYFLKLPKPQGANAKISEKSKQLQQVILKTRDGADRKKNILQYNHDHLGILKNPKLVRIIEKHERVDVRKEMKKGTFVCFSDNAYRINRWKNKKGKYLVVTQKHLFIFTPPKDLKRVVQLREIRQIKTRAKKDNFICFVTEHKNDEMLELFKKNELLLFFYRLIRTQALNITIRPNVESFLLLNTSNKNVVIAPEKLKKFHPVYNSTFNFASRKNKLMNIYIWRDGVFSEDYKKKVALIVDMGILVFSMVKWNLERFVPFGGEAHQAPRS